MIVGRGKFIPIEEGKETYIGQLADLYRFTSAPRMFAKEIALWRCPIYR